MQSAEIEAEHTRSVATYLLSRPIELPLKGSHIRVTTVKENRGSETCEI